MNKTDKLDKQPNSRTPRDLNVGQGHSRPILLLPNTASSSQQSHAFVSFSAAGARLRMHYVVRPPNLHRKRPSRASGSGKTVSNSKSARKAKEVESCVRTSVISRHRTRHKTPGVSWVTHSTRIGLRANNDLKEEMGRVPQRLQRFEFVDS